MKAELLPNLNEIIVEIKAHLYIVKKMHFCTRNPCFLY